MHWSSVAVTAVFAAFCSVTSAQSAEPDCVPQTEVDVTRIDASVILIGEVHGTQEIPRFTAGLVCSLLHAGRLVILGLEHSSEQQHLLNCYVTSSGDERAKAALLQGINWRKYSDGRGSQAMYELVDEMRRLRLQGQPVGLLAINGNENIDVPMTSAVAVQIAPADNATLNRVGNEEMAYNVLRAMAAYRPYVVVVLAGYSHTSTIQDVSNNPMFLTYRPMGQVIAAEVPVFTIGIETTGGEHGGVGTGGAKVYPLEAGPLYVPGVRVDAMVHFDRMTASMPARNLSK